MWPFSDLQYGFRSSQSTLDLLTVVSYRFARAINRSGATRAVAVDISKAIVSSRVSRPPYLKEKKFFPPITFPTPASPGS